MDGLPYVFHNRGTDNNVCSRISQFACNDTMKTRLSFLDQELSVFGYPSIQTSSGLDNVTLINVVHDLLQVYRKSLKNQSDANDNRRCSESDVMRFKQMFYNTKEELAGKISELKSKNMMESQMNQKIDALKMKVKTEQEKTRKMTLEFTSRDSQYKHEKKKLQQEINRLLEKLNKLLQDKKKENFRSFEILNSLKRPDGSRGKWTTDKTKKSNENDMYRIIISNYEDAQSVIIKENEDMRKYLKQMQQEISSALKEKSCNKKQEKKQCNGKQSSTTVHHSDGEDSDYSDDSIEICNGDETTPEELFSMPYDMVKEDIERSLNSKWRALKKEILRHRNHHPPPSTPDSGKKVDELETIIRQQQEVIDLLTAESEDYNKKQKQKQRSVDMLILEEKAELEKQRTFIEKEKFDLDKERRNYTKALGQLHDDRLKLEKDRCSWLKNHFFQKSPFWREELIGEKIPSNMKKKNSKKLSDNLSKQQQQKESKPSPKIKYNPVVVTTECTREADGRSSSSSSSQDSPPPRVFPSVIKSLQQLESNEQEKLIEQAKREGSNFCYENFCCYLARKREKITERWKSVNLENVGVGGGPAINYATDNSLLEEEESTTTTIGSSQLQQLTDDDDDDEPVMECTQQARMFTITKSPAHHHHRNLQPQPAAGIINNNTTTDDSDDDDSSSELATSLPRKYSRPSRRLSFTYDDDDES